MTTRPEDGALMLAQAPVRVTSPSAARTGEADFVAEVDELVALTLRELAQQWVDLSPPDPSPDVLDPDSVLRILEAFAASGGKRLRPRMAYWGSVAVDGASAGRGHRDLVIAATALELLHAFALVHDDVMDASAERRGQPSVHERARKQHLAAGARGAADQYGSNIAMLVGDLLHSEADALAARMHPALRATWRTLCIELMAGQARDLVGAANGRRDLEHARAVAAMKSGAYTVWRPLQLGASAAGGTVDTLAALRRFGLRLGEAFALRDDVLGVLGDPARTGKPVGDDIVAGKPTVLVALAERAFSAEWRMALRQAGAHGCRPEQAAALAHEMLRSGVVDQVEEMIESAVSDASAALDTPAVSPTAAAGLTALAHRIAWRDS